MSLPPPDLRALKGRAALSNPAGRFDRQTVEAVDDGWYTEPLHDAVPTTVEPDHARGILQKNSSPDVPFDQSINPYRGCEHGCIYCYARPSHAYLGLSAGIDFETRLYYKVDAAGLLRAELARPGYVCRPVAIGANTDPYQPIEREYRVTRSVLEVLAQTRHPVTLITKSALILRDLDLLTDLARDDLVRVSVSITTLDSGTKRALEPRTASPQARLRAVRELAAAGIPTGVLVAPVIPAITDQEMEAILEAAVGAGATRAHYIVLRLPYEIKDLFRQWLGEHFPQRAGHVMSLIRSMRAGRDNDPRYGARMRGSGPIADLLSTRFRIACQRLGIDTSRSDAGQRTDCFRAPGKSSAQFELGF